MHDLIAMPLPYVFRYMVNQDRGNLRSSIFFIWGGLCTACFVYAYLLIPETKGLTLEQVDKMMEETTPRTSAKWRPHTTFVEEMAGKEGRVPSKAVEEVKAERTGH